MRFAGFLLNLPWTIFGILAALASFPLNLRLSNQPVALIFKVKSFWWLTWRGSKKGARAITIGHVVLLSPFELDRDLEHELIHVEQFARAPLIQPVLYLYQTFRHGYRQNKYEIEAYEKSSSHFDEI